jgi:hypothetical protein
MRRNYRRQELGGDVERHLGGLHALLGRRLHQRRLPSSSDIMMRSYDIWGHGGSAVRATPARSEGGDATAWLR